MVRFAPDILLSFAARCVIANRQRLVVLNLGYLRPFSSAFDVVYDCFTKISWTQGKVDPHSIFVNFA